MSINLRGTIRELDGLRGIAILLVIIHHYWPAEGPWAEWAALPHLGWIGVDLFFVVSGFLITGILLDTRSAAGFFRTFYVRRALRIFPLYYLFLLLVFVGIPMLQGGPWASSEFVRQSGSPWWYLLYQGNLREALVGHEPAYVLAPLWSLAIEEQFYLVWPFLVSTIPRVRLRPVLVATIVGALAYRFVTFLIWPANERVQYLATPSRLDVLAIGALIALGLRDRWLHLTRRTIGRAALTGIGVLATTFALGGMDRTTPFGRTLGYSIVGVTFGFVVLWAVTGREAKSTAWLRWKPLRALGKVCYGVYLLQRPMEVVVGKVTEAAGIPWNRTELSTVPILMAVTFATAALSWFAFERPILRLKRHFSVSGHPQATTAP
ncbi:MAG: acyltransferase [Gemmatimonadota bacterium]